MCLLSLCGKIQNLSQSLERWLYTRATSTLHGVSSTILKNGAPQTSLGTRSMLGHRSGPQTTCTSNKMDFSTAGGISIAEK